MKRTSYGIFLSLNNLKRLFYLKSLLSFGVFLINFSVHASTTQEPITCATQKNIENLSSAEAIDLTYKSGPSHGNFGYEAHPMDGLVYQKKEVAHGNLDILELYPILNADVLKEKEGVDWRENHRHQYAGIYQPTYFQAQECRRQVLVTGIRDDGGKRYFTGWINVELCDPKLKEAFVNVSAYYDSIGQKMDSIEKLIAVVEQQDPSLGSRLRENLDTSAHPGVYYPKLENGHIAPRFSLRFEEMYFEHESYEHEQYDETTCKMTVVPTSAYSGVRPEETHYFSQSLQDQMGSDEDPIFLGIFDKNGNSVSAPFYINEVFNQPKR